MYSQEELEERAACRLRLIYFERKLPGLQGDIYSLLGEIREIDEEIEKKGLLSKLLEDPDEDEITTYKGYIEKINPQTTAPESIYENIARYVRRLIQLLTNPL